MRSDHSGMARTKIVCAAMAFLAVDCAYGQAVGTLPGGVPWLAGAALLVASLVLIALRWRRLSGAIEPGITWIRALSEDEFIRRLGQGFRRRGYRVASPGATARAAGVGLVLTKAGRTFLVHCLARHDSEVDEEPIRALAGALLEERSAGGLVVTCGEFTEAARVCAAESSVGLVSAAALVELMQRRPRSRVQARAPVDRKEPYFGTPLVEVPECPRCGGPLVRADGGGKWVCSLRRCVSGR